MVSYKGKREQERKGKGWGKEVEWWLKKDLAAENLERKGKLVDGWERKKEMRKDRKERGWGTGKERGKNWGFQKQRKEGEETELRGRQGWGVEGQTTATTALQSTSIADNRHRKSTVMHSYPFLTLNLWNENHVTCLCLSLVGIKKVFIFLEVYAWFLVLVTKFVGLM